MCSVHNKYIAITIMMVTDYLLTGWLIDQMTID